MEWRDSASECSGGFRLSLLLRNIPLLLKRGRDSGAGEKLLFAGKAERRLLYNCGRALGGPQEKLGGMLSDGIAQPRPMLCASRKRTCPERPRALTLRLKSPGTTGPIRFRILHEIIRPALGSPVFFCQVRKILWDICAVQSVVQRAKELPESVQRERNRFIHNERFLDFNIFRSPSASLLHPS